MADPPDSLTSLMTRFRNGDHEAAGALVQQLYPQLKKIASARMRIESDGHTWQTTALVNELYLELIKIRALRAAGPNEDERAAFLNLSAHLMRRLLLQYARPLRKRAVRDELPEDLACEGHESLAEIDNLLDRLGQIDPQIRRVVEMRVFEGLTVAEVAQRTGSSERNVARQWAFARTFLAEAFGKQAEPA
jgi:RNA polymerase sigma factor (TIGR02999 family)